MRLSNILSALILSSGISYAITIDEVKELAVQNSYIIKKEQNNLNIQMQNEDLSMAKFKPTISSSYSYSKRDVSSFVNTKESSKFNVSLNYNLFNGFSDKYELESSELNTKAQNFKKDASIKDIELQAALEYLDILMAKDKVKVESKNTTLLESRVQESQNFYHNGLISKDELLKVEVELKSAYLQLARAKASLKTAKQKLSNTVVKDISNEEFITSNAKFEDTLNEDKLTKKAYKNRSELKYLYTILKSQKEMLESINGGYYPKLDLSLGYNRYGNDTSANSDGLMPDEKVGTLTLSYELYSGGTMSAYKASQNSLISNLNHDINILKNDIKLSIQNSLENINTYKISLELAKKSIEQSNEYLKIVTDRFKEQLATNTDVLDATLALLRSKNNLVDAKYNLHKEYLMLKRISE